LLQNIVDVHSATQLHNFTKWEVEVGGLQVQGQAGLYCEPLSQKKKVSRKIIM
jgi:hypothetical protein